MDLDNENPWEGILSSIMFAIRSTVYTTTQNTLLQLIFGGDAILNINQEANCQLIKQHQQVLINKGNQKENRRKQSNMYRTGDKVLFKNVWKTKINYESCIGPYTMTEVCKIIEYHRVVKGILQILLTCITLPLSKNRNDSHNGVVCHRQV